MITESSTARIKNDDVSTINIALRNKRSLCIPVYLSIVKKFAITKTKANRSARLKKIEK
jgi:hypothetical protein